MEEPRESEGEFTKVFCASWGYHAYRQIWNLRIRPKKKNLHDPYAMGIYENLLGK